MTTYDLNSKCDKTTINNAYIFSGGGGGVDGLCCGRSGGEGPVGGHPRPRAHPGHGHHLQRCIQTETKTQEIT